MRIPKAQSDNNNILFLTQTPYSEDDDKDPPSRYTKKLSGAAIGAIIGVSFGLIFLLVVSIISIYAYCCSNTSKSTTSASNGISGSGSQLSSELRASSRARSPTIGKKNRIFSLFYTQRPSINDVLGGGGSAKK